MLTAKKSLGQHFLKSPAIVRKMAELATVTTGDIVLEIGPGKGVLTRELLSRGAHVIVIEKDDRMIPYLEDVFSDEINSKQLTLIHGDVLDNTLWKTNTELTSLRAGKYKLIANIPYYITGLLLRRFLEEGVQPVSLTFLVQKEVAQQIFAHNSKEGILSLSVKAYGTPVNGGTVKRILFSPPPKVDSAILHITAISKGRFEGKVNEQEYFKFIHAGFGSKRKTLVNNFERELGITKDRTVAVFHEMGIDERVRGEDLSIDQWFMLIAQLIRA